MVKKPLAVTLWRLKAETASAVNFIRHMTHTTRKPFAALALQRVCVCLPQYTYMLSSHACLYITSSAPCVCACVWFFFFSRALWHLHSFCYLTSIDWFCPYPLPHFKHCLPFPHPHTHTQLHTHINIHIHAYSYVNSQILIACPIASGKVSSISCVPTCV